MILKKVETKCESNMKGSTAFSIKQSAAMFRILSSGLYSNKERAVIREVACNAVDANVDAGRGDIPITIHLPGILEPYFSIKDNGTGLDQDQMKDIYTQYGTSTKTNRNDQIGALGLGSKSPFSYIDSFSVISITNGTKRTYSCFVDGKGEPQLMPFGEEPTEEENGIEVSFPVKKEDWNKFRVEAEIVFRPFKVRPNVVGNSDYRVKDFEVLLSSKDSDWQLVQDTYSGNIIRVAVQGNIEYPINTHLIEEHLSTNAKKLLKENFRLHFNIGELDIAASREELGYDKSTIDNICAKFERMALEIQEEVNNKLQSIDTLYKAREYLADLKANSYIYSGMNFTYKGDKLHETVYNISSRRSLVKYFKNNRGTITRQSLSSKNEFSTEYDFHTPVKREGAVYVYVDDGKKNKAVTKARSLVESTKTVYLIEDIWLIQHIGNPEYINASSIEIPKKGSSNSSSKSGSSVDRTGLFYKRYKDYSYSGYWFDSTYSSADMLGLDLSTDFFYIEINKSKVCNEFSIHKMRNYAIKLGIITSSDKIYGVAKAHANTSKFKNCNGIEFSAFITDAIKKSKNLKDGIRKLKHKNKLDEFVRLNGNFIDLLELTEFFSEVQNESIFIHLHKEYKELKEASSKPLKATLNFETVRELASFLNIEVKHEKVKPSIVHEKYPLISSLHLSSVDLKGVINYVKAINIYNIHTSSSANTETKYNSNKKVM